MKVYKGVRLIKGKRYSAVVYRCHGGIRYNDPGQPTVAPEGTRLLAFSTKKEALLFFKDWKPKFEVWRAEAKNTQKVSALTWSWSRANFIRFWQGIPAVLILASAPQGTVCCSELTLLEKVE